jgi:hypothetical protein
MAEMATGGATVEALESLYRADFLRFVRAAAAIVGDEGTGRDAVQEAFAQAIRKRTSFKGDAPLEAWVWRVVINEALTLRRRSVLELEWDSEISALPSGNHVPSGTWPYVPGLLPFPSVSVSQSFSGTSPTLTTNRSQLLGVEVGTVSATLATAHAARRRSYEEAVR